MNNVDISNCSAQRSGGGIFSGGLIDLTDLRCNDTHANQDGGCLRLQQGGIVHRSTFARCNTSDRGGGLFVAQGMAEVVETQFHNCDAANGGGAMATLGVALLLDEVELTGCRSGKSGGGVLFDSPLGLFYSNDLTLRGNTAALFGGGMVVRARDIDVDGSTVVQNKARVGGGLALFGLTSIGGAGISDNFAAERGGGLREATIGRL